MSKVLLLAIGSMWLFSAPVLKHQNGLNTFFLTTKPEIELFSITWQRKQAKTQRGEDSLFSVFSTLWWFKTGRGRRSSEVRGQRAGGQSLRRSASRCLHVSVSSSLFEFIVLGEGDVMFCISVLSCLCLASCFPDKDVEILGSLSSKCSKRR